MQALRYTDLIAKDAVPEYRAFTSTSSKLVEKIAFANWRMYKAPYLLGTRDWHEIDTLRGKADVYQTFLTEILFPKSIVVLGIFHASNFRRVMYAR